MTQSGLRGDAAGARVGIEDHNDCEVAVPCTPCHAILKDNSGETKYYRKYTVEKTSLKIGRVKMFAREIFNSDACIYHAEWRM